LHNYEVAVTYRPQGMALLLVRVCYTRVPGYVESAENRTIQKTSPSF